MKIIRLNHILRAFAIKENTTNIDFIRVFKDNNPKNTNHPFSLYTAIYWRKKLRLVSVFVAFHLSVEIYSMQMSHFDCTIVEGIFGVVGRMPSVRIPIPISDAVRVDAWQSI